MSSGSDRAIGGYFELELPPPRPALYPQALAFQSARAAFLALLRAGKPRRVWMPRHLCDAMLHPLDKEGIDCAFYALDENLGIADSVEMRPQDWLLYVNYFGVCGKNVADVLGRFDRRRVVLDHSQAFYSPPAACLATLYSPRKFLGIPDGGLLVTTLPVSVPPVTDQASADRFAHLLQRLADSPASGYAHYQQAEDSLAEFEPLAMSRLTRRLLGSVDHQEVKARRNRNFRFLHEALGRFNRFAMELENVDAPLCYPFFSSHPGLRKRLLAEQVFVPTYWLDAARRAGEGSVEADFIHRCIPLPCDQRYDPAALERVARLIHDMEAPR